MVWAAIQSALGLAPPPATVSVARTFDESCVMPRHLSAGDRVIYRAGVHTDKEHPLEGRVGTLAYASLIDASLRISGQPYAHAVVHFDGDAAPTPVNARNVITLLDWLVEREKARAAA